MFGRILFLFCVATILSATFLYAQPIDMHRKSFAITASDLPDSDGGGTHIHNSDPYLIIRNKGGDQIFRSPTQDNTLNPIFLVTLDCHSDEVYTFEIFDEDTFNPDDSHGQIAVPADRLVGTHLLANPSGGRITIKEV